MSDDEPTNPGIGHVLRAIEAKDVKDALRHKAVEALANELAQHRATLSDHGIRLTKVERNSNAELRWPAWALVGVVTAGELAIIGLEAARLWSPL